MSMLTKLAQFARTPQGKKLAGKAMEMAKDPKTKAKIEEQRAKLAGKDKPASGGPGAPVPHDRPATGSPQADPPAAGSSTPSPDAPPKAGSHTPPPPG